MRVSEAAIATLSRDGPGWVASALQASPRVVVRRPVAAAGLIGVGVRGSTRSERFGAVVSSDEMSETITPECLARTSSWTSSLRGEEIPAIRALEGVAKILDGAAHIWGPVGSVGFELATGRPVASVTSDLDIVIRCAKRWSVDAAQQLEGELHAGECRVDVILETPFGGVSLRDLANASGAVLLRTFQGPLLVEDPWAEVFLAAAS